MIIIFTQDDTPIPTLASIIMGGYLWAPIFHNLTLPLKPTLQSHRSITSLQTLTQSRERSTKSFSRTQTHSHLKKTPPIPSNFKMGIQFNLPYNSSTPLPLHLLHPHNHQQMKKTSMPGSYMVKTFSVIKMEPGASARSTGCQQKLIGPHISIIAQTSTISWGGTYLAL